MFGSRTTVKKVRNSLTWFSHYSGWLVFPAYGELFGPVAVVTARTSQRGLSDQSIFPMGWQEVAKHSSIPVFAQPNRSRCMVRGSVCTAACLAWYYRHWPSLLEGPLPTSSLSVCKWGYPTCGKVSPQWHPLKYHLWNAGPSYHIGRLEELLILNRPCRPGEDVHDSVLPKSYRQAWKTWEQTRKEIEAKATTAGVIWFVEEQEVVQRILEIISRDEIDMNIACQEAREHDNLKEGRATKRRRILKLEMVPERWPLARLSFSLQTCVDHLDRVLAGCCWEV